jgi:FtsH-binding integral membrane protein
MAYEFQTAYGIDVDSDERAQFFRRVFMHLAGAVALFVGLEYLLIDSELGVSFNNMVLTGGRGVWLLVLGGFSLITWMCRGMAHGQSRPLQYLALALYAFVEALIFVPLVLFADGVSRKSGDENLLLTGGILTGILFLSMVLVVLVSRRDFSFLRTFLVIGSFIALGLIVCGALFGFNLGLAFSGGMVVLACASILYDTSKIMHHYDSEMYVAAALELFASLMLLLWYILRILISLTSRR